MLDEFIQEDGLEEVQGDGESLESGGDVELEARIEEQDLTVMFFFVPFGARRCKRRVGSWWCTPDPTGPGPLAVF